MSDVPRGSNRPLAKQRAERNLNRLLFRRKLLSIHPTYKQFCDEIIKKKPKPRTRLEQIAIDVQKLKKAESREPLCLQSSYDVEYYLLKAFSQTKEGAELLKSLQIPGSPQLSIEVLPPLADVAAGPIDFSRNLEDGRYLNIKVDLWQGKRLIKETFAAMLNRYQPKATRPPLIRGDSIRTEEEMDQMLQAFQLVEKHEGGIHPAMWEMFPETKGKHLHSDDPSEAHEEEGIDPDDLQRMHDKIQRWHLKIKEFLEAHDLYPLPSKSN